MLTKLDVEAGTEDAGRRDDEVVVELGADDHDGVEPVAAVDVHRCVDRVLDEVGAAAAAQVGECAMVFLRAGKRERLDEERVVPVVAEEVSVSRLWKTMKSSLPTPPLIVIGLLMPFESQPCVVSIVAKTSSGATPARAGVRRELVELPDLEEVVALVTVDRDRGARVVHVELVVAVAAVDDDRLEVLVVVDALDRIGRGGRERGRAVDQRDEREAVVGGRRAKQEDVRVLVPLTVSESPPSAGRRVEHVDQRVRPAADRG